MNRIAPDLRAATATLYAREGAPQARGSALKDAHKHTKRVRFLRIALPALVLAGVVIVALILLVDPLRIYRQLPVEFSKLSIEGNKITMEAPKLTGFTRDKKPYNITAESATQDLTQPNIVELNGIHGNVDQASRGGTEVRAKSGVYDIKAENLQLHGGIEIHSESGYHIYLNDAFIEVRKGKMVTKNPVNATFPDGSLEAARAEIQEHGSVVIFDGGVVVNMQLPPQEKPGAENSKTATGGSKR